MGRTNRICVYNKIQETMTAKELKEALANVPDDAEVFIYVRENALVNISSVNYEEDVNIFEIG